ncbi:MAG: hypothetical protein AAF223_03545 [Bacteroidota bacterium]
MPFKNGHQKIGGRVAGTPNKFTSERKAWLNKVLTQIETKHLEEDIGKLSPRDRVRLYADLLEYTIPKLNRSERPPTEVEELMSMTPEEQKAEMRKLEAELKNSA